VKRVASASAGFPRGDSHLMISGPAAENSELEWLVLFDVEMARLDEGRVTEIWERLGRLKALTFSIKAAGPRSLKGMRILDSDQLGSWEHWFRDLPAAKHAMRRGGGDADPLRIKIRNPRFLGGIVLILILLAGGSAGAAASGFVLLGLAAYLVKLVLLAGMAALAISLPTLASWLEQARTLAFFEALLFLAFEATEGALFAPSTAARCLLAAPVIFGVFYGAGKITEYFESSIAGGVLAIGTLTLISCGVLAFLLFWVGSG
jgi:hypothetical protein